MGTNIVCLCVCLCSSLIIVHVASLLHTLLSENPIKEKFLNVFLLLAHRSESHCPESHLLLYLKAQRSCLEGCWFSVILDILAL